MKLGDIMGSIRPYYEFSLRDEHQDDCSVSNLWVIASLEIAVKDASGVGIIMKLNSYPKDIESEGYWAPPNIQYKVPVGQDGLVGSRIIEENFTDFLSKEVDDDRTMAAEIKESVTRLAESFGLREVVVKRSSQEAIFEVKPSVNNPRVTNAFYTLRYQLVKATNYTYINLVDPEGRHGFVTLPIKADTTRPANMGRDPNNTGVETIMFLGKPVISGLTRVLEDDRAKQKLESTAVDIAQVPSHRESHGVICAADISGYGTALAEKLRTLAVDPEEIRGDFRRKILNNLESVLVNLGTTEVQSAGDGFIAGFPHWKYGGMETPMVEQVLSKWFSCIEKIEYEINAQMREDVGTRHLVVGSRIALVEGKYSYGRINGLSSFFPSFDGREVIEAARLEQGLNASTSKMEILMKDGTRPLYRKFHYAILSERAAATISRKQRLVVPGGEWHLLGECEVRAKEYVGKPVFLYRASLISDEMLN